MVEVEVEQPALSRLSQLVAGGEGGEGSIEWEASIQRWWEGMSVLPNLTLKSQHGGASEKLLQSATFNSLADLLLHNCFLMNPKWQVAWS